MNVDLTLVATTPYTRECEAEELAAKTCPTVMEIYEVADARLAEGLRFQPAVLSGIEQTQRGGWLDVAMAQYIEQAKYPVPLVADGPKQWQRVRASVDRRFGENFGDGTTIASASTRSLPDVVVTNIVEGNGSVSFTVDQVGVPIVVKESYFPTWRAKGADGPYRLAPNMMVVIPTERDVVLRIERDGAGWAGLLLTAAGLLGVGALVVRVRRMAVGAATQAEGPSSGFAGASRVGDCPSDAN